MCSYKILTVTDHIGVTQDGFCPGLVYALAGIQVKIRLISWSFLSLPIDRCKFCSVLIGHEKLKQYFLIGYQWPHARVPDITL